MSNIADDPAKNPSNDRRLLLSQMSLVKGLFGGTVFFIILFSTAQLFPPKLYRRIFEAVLSKEPVSALSWLVLLLLGAQIFIAVTAAGRSYFLQRLGLEFGLRVRAKLFGRIQRLPLSWHDERQSGQTLSTMMEDTVVMENTAINCVDSFIAAPLLALGVLTLCFMTDYRLALLGFGLAIPALLFTALSLARDPENLMAKIREKGAVLGARTQESLGALRDIKLLRAEEALLFRYEESARELSSLQNRFQARNAVYAPLLNLISMLAVCLLLYAGSSFVRWKWVEPGVVVELTAYALLLFKPLTQMLRSMYLWKIFGAHAARLGQILRAEEERLSGPAGKFPSVHSIRVDGLTFHYPGSDPSNKALSGVNLALQPGKLWAIAGPNGAGKSSLLHLLAGLYEPDSGSMVLDGRDIGQIPKSTLRESIGLLPQQPILLSDTLEANLRLAKAGATEDELKALLEKIGFDINARHFSAGLKTPLGERGLKLSAGQKASVAWARLLLRDTPVLLLDEPTAFLDPQVEDRMMALLAELCKSRIVLITSNKFSSLRRADLIYVMKEGSILEQGDLKTLKENREGHFYRLYESSLKSQNE